MVSSGTWQKAAEQHGMTTEELQRAFRLDALRKGLASAEYALGYHDAVEGLRAEGWLDPYQAETNSAMDHGNGAAEERARIRAAIEAIPSRYVLHNYVAAIRAVFNRR